MESSPIQSPCDPRSTSLTRLGGELTLSNQGLGELIRSVLGKGACFRFRARGFSMSPFIKDGDIVLASPFGDAAPGLGDVVIFTVPWQGKIIIHRVVAKAADSYLIKGDNVPESYDVVPGANILGYVRMVERGGKKVSLGLGPEKVLIALLTRRGLLLPLLRHLRVLVRPILVSRTFGHGGGRSGK